MQPILNMEIRPVGKGLNRPECVVGAPNGDVYIPDWRGGVAVIRVHGGQEVWLADRPPIDLKPNGITPTADGGFLIANLGDDGGFWELGADGGLTPVLTELEGRPVPPANFVFIDDDERIWGTVSTRHLPRQQAWRPDVRDGLLIRIDRGVATLVADDLHYTNEVRVDPAGRHVYVVETFGKRLIRFPLRAGGALGERETVAQFGDGFFPDGFAFDAEGGIWVTSLICNQIARITPDGRLSIVISETNAVFTTEAQAAFDERRMARDHLGPIPDTRYQHVTSIAFGGPDGRDAWLGCLHTDGVFAFRSPVPGAPCPHWRYRLP